MDHLQAKMGYSYIIGCLTRPGVVMFTTKLEYMHYPPNTELNDGYNIFRIMYAGAQFCIIEIPSADCQVAEQLAKECNLKFVNGKPYNATSEEFRLACDSRSCFTLETIDHTMLPGTDHELQKILQSELMAARAIAES